MKPAPFSLVRARTVEQAIAALATYGEDGKLLAGGQSLIPSLSMRLSQPSVVIDVNAVQELSQLSSDGGGWTIGSLVRHATLEHLDGEGATPQLIRSAARHIGHLPIRYRGSIGGSLAHADPAAEWPAVALALDAHLEIRSSKGVRSEPAGAFLRGPFWTSLEEDELLYTVRLPAEVPGAYVGFSEVSQRAGDFAVVLAAVRLQVADGAIKLARVALAGLAGGAARATSAEEALVGRLVADVGAEEVARVARSDWNAFDDAHSSASYKLAMGEVVVERALAQALESARSNEWRVEDK